MPTSYQNQEAVKFYIKERRRFDWKIRGERVIKFGRIKPGDCILDLCCGPSFVAKVIRKKIGGKGKIIGIDSSLNFIRYAKKICCYKNVLFKYGNVENLDKYIGDQKFDFIILLASWLWIKNKNKLISKIKQALKADGKFILSLSGDNLYHSNTKKFYWRFRKNLKNVIIEMFPNINPSYLNKLSNLNKKYLKDCTSQIVKNGFKIVSIKEVKRQLSTNDKLFLYQNPARTEWIGKFKPQDRFKIIKKALKRTVKEISNKNIERHTYYIILRLA